MNGTNEHPPVKHQLIVEQTPLALVVQLRYELPKLFAVLLLYWVNILVRYRFDSNWEGRQEHIIECQEPIWKYSLA